MPMAIVHLFFFFSFPSKVFYFFSFYKEHIAVNYAFKQAIHLALPHTARQDNQWSLNRVFPKY